MAFEDIEVDPEGRDSQVLQKYCLRSSALIGLQNTFTIFSFCMVCCWCSSYYLTNVTFKMQITYLHCSSVLLNQGTWKIFLSIQSDLINQRLCELARKKIMSSIISDFSLDRVGVTMRFTAKKISFNCYR